MNSPIDLPQLCNRLLIIDDKEDVWEASFHEQSLLDPVNCIIKCTNTNSANHMVFQSHGNNDTGFSSIKRGENILFKNCHFSIADGSSYAHIDLRNTVANPDIPCFAEFINCSGIKLYVPSTQYKMNFVGTERHT